MTGWNSLPQEIRSMILGWVVVHDHIAPYAPVSIEWRDTIEKKIFQHLRIHASTSDARGSTPTVFHRLSQLCDRHRRLIKHIWLNVELAKRNSDGSWIDHKEHAYIGAAITRLFRALQFWPAQDDLTLGIGVYEPMNDLKEWFRGLHIEFPAEQDPDMSRLSDSQLRSLVTVSCTSQRILLGCFAFKLQVCPSVRAVTRFLLPRQCQRRLAPAALSCVLERLPRLEEICLESWEASGVYAADYLDRYERDLFLRPSHFKNVKSMTVFRDRNEYFNTVYRRQEAEYRRRFALGATQPDQSLRDRPALAREFAVASLSLENLSVSFIVDAVDFFGQCQENWLWAGLRSLTLTSRHLTCDGDSSEIHGQLQKAAQMAKRMPKLERLIIWNGGANEACAFTYRKQQHSASVTWQAKEGTKLNPAVYSTWENIHPGCFLHFREKHTWHSITSDADAIMCLGLEHVVDNVSLGQMQLGQMQLGDSMPWVNS
ncbi:f-box domain protein [Fusarium tjaetaba]|uniref:F-box domain protein n=1 Tax=Fusarium tjaetaba TaxID=1567544 RepID=A0A8H5S653_9HYPO|nr:f-box domain protein [Fusarium tjaetaba]KAF5644887.1 f-box domain protein [Fusarium tjaetaba]